MGLLTRAEGDGKKRRPRTFMEFMRSGAEPTPRQPNLDAIPQFIQEAPGGHYLAPPPIPVPSDYQTEAPPFPGMDAERYRQDRYRAEQAPRTSFEEAALMGQMTPVMAAAPPLSQGGHAGFAPPSAAYAPDGGLARDDGRWAGTLTNFDRDWQAARQAAENAYLPRRIARRYSSPWFGGGDGTQ